MDFSDSPVIAAVREDIGFEKALSSTVGVVFLLNSDLLTLKEKIKKCHDAGKKIFIHVDFTEGLGKDKVGMEALARFGASGVITTRSGIVKAAKEAGLSTIQRFFIVDSHSFDTAIESVKSAHPDMIEVMPALVSREIKRLKEKLKIPVIAGGLIEEKNEIYQALSSGASAVSTGKWELWE